MKKILLILVIFLGIMEVLAQTNILTFDSYIQQTQMLEKSIGQCFKNKEYKLGEKLSNETITLFNRLSKENQDKNRMIQANNYYNLACIYSLQNQKKEAVEAFAKSTKQWGYTDYSHAKIDSDLDNIRAEQLFIALMADIREKGDYQFILQQAGKYQVEDTTGLPHFNYEEASNGRLQSLKSLFNLDSIAGQGDEVSKIVNLMTWVHNSIKHDGSNYALCEFDAIDFYNYYKATGKGINCRGLAITLNECYLAMGFKSRFITCLPKDENDNDCHVITSVYSSTLRKWLWMDPTFNAYVKDENGNILSIEEVRYSLINGKSLVINNDANWNNQNRETKEHYIDTYMAKNLYWLQCPSNSYFNIESRYRNSKVIYISLQPLGYQHSDPNTKDIITHDPGYFWQLPK